METDQWKTVMILLPSVRQISELLTRQRRAGTPRTLMARADRRTPHHPAPAPLIWHSALVLQASCHAEGCPPLPSEAIAAWSVLAAAAQARAARGQR